MFFPLAVVTSWIIVWTKLRRNPASVRVLCWSDRGGGDLAVHSGNFVRNGSAVECSSASPNELGVGGDGFTKAHNFFFIHRWGESHDQDCGCGNSVLRLDRVKSIRFAKKMTHRQGEVCCVLVPFFRGLEKERLAAFCMHEREYCYPLWGQIGQYALYKKVWERSFHVLWFREIKCRGRADCGLLRG